MWYVYITICAYHIAYHEETLDWLAMAIKLKSELFTRPHTFLHDGPVHLFDPLLDHGPLAY